MRIDPSRLSRLLLALGQKTGAERNSETDGSHRSGKSRTAGASDRPRDIKVLRKELQRRLRELNTEAGGYESAASSIAIQEILRWEFGAEILEHPDFHRIADSITQTMLQDDRMAASLQKLIRDLASP